MKAWFDNLQPRERLVVALEGAEVLTEAVVDPVDHLQQLVDLLLRQLPRRRRREGLLDSHAALDVADLRELRELLVGGFHLHVAVVGDAGERDTADERHDSTADRELLHRTSSVGGAATLYHFRQP